MAVQVQDEHEDAPHALLNALSAHVHVPLAAGLPRTRAEIKQQQGPRHGARAGPCVGERRQYVVAARNQAELP